MNRFLHVLIAILPLAISVTIGYFLYRSSPTNVMLILLLLLIFIGVVASFVSYGMLKKSAKIKALKIDESFYPQLSEDLIYITPHDFSSKNQLTSGKLWIAGNNEQVELNITSIEFNKLLDEILISFNKGYALRITYIPTIGFDESQFQVFGFRALEFTKNKKELIKMNWTESGLLAEQNGEVLRINFPSRLPVVVFGEELMHE
jgi:hypothetical protein